MEKLKTGIIGCGKVASLHAKALSESNLSEFTAVCSRTHSKAVNFSDKYNVKPYSDIDEMIHEQGLNAVVICTPHPFHAEPAIKAMTAGANVLVEKPLASTLQDCDAMINTARKTGVKLATVSQRRFYPPCQRIRKAIDDGLIGKPVLGIVNMFGWRDKSYYESDPWRGTWKNEGGGVLVNQAPHQIDLLQWYMGPIKEVYGYWENLNHPYIEVEDTAIAVIRFKSGALGSIVVSNSQNPALYGKVMIHGSNGSCVGVQTDSGAMFIAGVSNIKEPSSNDYWTIPNQENKLSEWQKEDFRFFNKINPAEYFMKLQIDDFLDSIINNRPPLIDGQQGRITVEIFTAIYRSQRDRKPIEFPVQPENDDSFDGRYISAK